MWALVVQLALALVRTSSTHVASVDRRARHPVPYQQDTSSAPTTQQLVGFWNIYDDQATSDALSALASADGPPPSSLFSAPIVLRADGHASRGSDFPGGTWALETDGSRRRMRMTLTSRLLGQELRYDGLLFWLAPAGVAGSGLGAAFANLVQTDSEADEAADAKPELRVVGKVSRYNVTRGGDAIALGAGKPADFSMVKLEVDRSQLTPTIKPFSREVDPAELAQEMAEIREKDRTDAEQMRELLAGIRQLKAEGRWTGEITEGQMEGLLGDASDGGREDGDVS